MLVLSHSWGSFSKAINETRCISFSRLGSYLLHKVLVHMWINLYEFHFLCLRSAKVFYTVI